MVIGVDVSLSCCGRTLPTFRSLVGGVQDYLVHIWVAQQPPCSYAYTQPSASLILSCVLTPWLGFSRACLLPRDLPRENRTQGNPHHCLQAWSWHLGLSILPALLSPLVPTSPPLWGCSAVLDAAHDGGLGASPQNLFQYFAIFASRKLLGAWQRFLIILTWCFLLHFKNITSCPVIQCRQNSLYSSLYYLHWKTVFMSFSDSSF